MASTVEFGISKLHVGTYTDNNGTVTLGTPYHQAGAVSFTPEESGDNNEFYADNIVYWSEYNDGPISGDIEVAKFDDSFKTQFLGYGTLTTGGLAKIKGATKPKVYIAFQVEGDVEARRVIYYNVSLGAIGRNYNTITDSKEPATETLGVTVTGDNNTGVMFASFVEDDAGYDTLFTAPAAPVVAGESE